jgi:hypothetical protein
MDGLSLSCRQLDRELSDIGMMKAVVSGGAPGRLHDAYTGHERGVAAFLGHAVATASGHEMDAFVPQR